MDQEQEDGQAQENGQPDHPTVGHQHPPGHIASPHDFPLSQIQCRGPALRTGSCEFHGPQMNFPVTARHGPSGGYGTWSDTAAAHLYALPQAQGRPCLAAIAGSAGPLRRGPRGRAARRSREVERRLPSRIRSVVIPDQLGDRPQGFDLAQTWASTVAAVEQSRRPVGALVPMPAYAVGPLRERCDTDPSTGP
jgi:hypothetical protein